MILREFLTKELLNSLFTYRNGRLYWIKKTSKYCSNDISKPAGCKALDGYRAIKYNGRIYKEHILIWIYHNGNYPLNLQIDHINRDRSDNHIGNLRLVTDSQNKRNRNMQSNNRSGFNGVRFHKSTKKWEAKIHTDSGVVFLGEFDDKLEAIQARESANIEYGYHSTHGIKLT